jgi:hypothetical protein
VHSVVLWCPESDNKTTTLAIYNLGAEHTMTDYYVSATFREALKEDD